VRVVADPKLRGAGEPAEASPARPDDD
jgi:hypothetical protein